VKQPSATSIGAFVLGSLALIVAAILFFGGGSLSRNRMAAVSYFHGSVAGLRVGAPVTFRGVRVGEVKSVGIRLEQDMSQSIVQVNMELLPDTVEVHGFARPETPIAALVERGFSARLVLQSFVTGQLQVELDFRPELQPSRLGASSDVPEIPTVPSPFSALAQQLETLDVAAVVTGMQRTLASLDALLANPALGKTIDELPSLVADLRRTVKTIEREAAGSSAAAQVALRDSAAALQKTLASVDTLAQNLDRETTSTLSVARGTLKSANAAFESANGLLDPRGETVTQVQRAVDDLAATAGRLRNFAERVDRDPSVLVRGR